MPDALIVTKARVRALCAISFCAGIVACALLWPSLGASVSPHVPVAIRGEVLTIAEYLCGPNGGTATMQPHADPERFTFVCRNEARFADQRITLR